VPEAFYVLLTLDFQTRGKSRVARFCRGAFLTGQDLPVKGKFLPGWRKFLPGFESKPMRIRLECRRKRMERRGELPRPLRPIFPKGFPFVQVI
jgi:hypothetical protein